MHIYTNESEIVEEVKTTAIISATTVHSRYRFIKVRRLTAEPRPPAGQKAKYQVKKT